MIQLLIRLCLILLVVNQFVTPCSAFRSYSNRGGSKYNRGLKVPAITNTGSSVGEANSRRGLGISAWGIVVLVVAMILAVMGLYYFSICYPTICRKNTKYNLMGEPTIA